MSQDEVRALVQHIERLAEEEGEHTRTFLSHIDHPDPLVREAAVWALWSGDLLLMLEPLLNRVESDPDEQVRAAAVSILGRYVFEGLMLGSDEAQRPVRDAVHRVDTYLHTLLSDEAQPELLRRRALESLSFDTDDELEALIEEWLSSEHELFRKSAAFAMGRANVERLSKQLILALDDISRMVQQEAIRSVGELGLKKALPKLIALARGDDPEMALEAIQALGEVGGAKAEAALKTLSGHGDKARAALAREVLAELSGDE